jgi:hypothetical protein
MKRLAFLLVLPLLMFFASACQEMDPGPAIPYSEDSIHTPDTVASDYRTAFIGLFDITCTYREAGLPDQFYALTDSIRLLQTRKLEIPMGNGAKGYPIVDSTGAFFTDFLVNPYQIYDGAYIGLDSFFLDLHMDVQPHTFSYEVMGHRH